MEEKGWRMAAGSPVMNQDLRTALMQVLHQWDEVRVLVQFEICPETMGKTMAFD